VTVHSDSGARNAASASDMYAASTCRRHRRNERLYDIGGYTPQFVECIQRNDHDGIQDADASLIPRYARDDESAS
jgi:hypothetical protein